MTYTVKELFKTLQGEGAHAGRAAVFCRFAGCNLWTGREQDRETAVCRFCDTDFVGTDGPGGGKFATAESLAETIAHTWDGAVGRRYVVFTGGEPLLQLDEALVAAMHAENFEIAIETNGTRTPPPGSRLDLRQSQGRAALALTSGDELKLVYPQPDAPPEAFASLDFRHFFLQPMDGAAREANTAAAAAYCMANPTWRLSLQTHKLIGLP